MHVLPLAIGVLNVQPDDIVGHVIFVKACIDSLDVCLVAVVPAALVVPDGEVLGQGCAACQPSILGRHLHMPTLTCSHADYPRTVLVKSCLSAPVVLGLLSFTYLAHS